MNIWEYALFLQYPLAGLYLYDYEHALLGNFGTRSCRLMLLSGTIHCLSRNSCPHGSVRPTPGIQEMD